MMTPEFPVSWDNETDKELFFVHERSHFPGQVTPLDFSLNVMGMVYGFNQAAQRYGVPLLMVDRLFNTYLYEAITPTQRETLPDKSLDEAMSNLDALWLEAWLPEIQSNLAYWEAYPLINRSVDDLLAHLVDTNQRLQRIWEIHFLLFFPTTVALSQFEELYIDLFGQENASGVYQLLTGFKSKTVEANEALWQLSRLALNMPTVKDALLNVETWPALSLHADGQTFLAELQNFLAVYGKRSNEWSIDAPFWLEDPTPVFTILRDYLTTSDRDVVAQFAHTVAERERAVTQVMAELAHYPKPVVAEFTAALKMAQISSFLSEEHFYWIEGQSSYQLRRVCLALGEALVQSGQIQETGDIFYLHFEEIVNLSTIKNLSNLIKSRKINQLKVANITPPKTIGDPPTIPPPNHPVSQALAKFFGEPLEQPQSGDMWQGFAASPGVAQGPARIIKSLSEASKIRPGDVLVADTTAPPWTSLFGSIVALVTDTGGVLSHGAIVAREYHIPAVVGVGVATTTIQDGQLIEVNGNTGVIRLINS